MRRFLLACCLILTACAGTPGKNSHAYVPPGVDISHFPATAAGYSRGGAMRHSPKSYSIGYDMFEPHFQNIVSLYFKEENISLPLLFEVEKQQIPISYPGAVLLRQYPVTLEKGGVSYQGRAAVFEYTTDFAGGQQQKVYSKVMLIQLPTRFFKLRSTVPVAHALDMDPMNQQLLDAVNWVF